MLIALRLWLESLRDLWWMQQRATDLRILWPACKEQAAELPVDDPAERLDYARAAFAMHAFHDNCWIKYYGEERLEKIIGEMT